jgi:DNA-binding XRE family transcriptional regulator
MTLQSVRETLGLSQYELDRRAGLPRGTVHQIETERNQNPSVAVAAAITAALRRAGANGVSIESLFIESEVA